MRLSRDHSDTDRARGASVRYRLEGADAMRRLLETLGHLLFDLLWVIIMAVGFITCVRLALDVLVKY